MYIVVTGGGTGGHVFPALEIIKELKRQDEKIKVIFVGNKNSLEEKMAKSSHLQFLGLNIKKIVGQNIFKKCLAIIFLALAILRSILFLFIHRPKAVIGVGGYVSAPMVIASFFLGIKRYVCEQNVCPGLANRYLAKIAHRVFISFLESKKFFPPNIIIHSGNPVRAEFFTHNFNEPKEGLKILITGGSLGARFLNQNVIKALQKIHSSCPKLFITHQTGSKMKEEVARLYEQAGIAANVISFIDDMPQAFLKHDVLISRAGATVCAEIMASGMPAILVPYPFANGHQKNNALLMSNLNAAIMVQENDDFINNLAQKIETIYKKPDTLLNYSHIAKSMGVFKASFIIVSTVLKDLSF
jgi:UDP-N-acetylglucosamine--N-acetylmuramyl-(pentapeptide) pyrophosphoryl-undecaprenol N-acetylglucosamine transferase